VIAITMGAGLLRFSHLAVAAPDDPCDQARKPRVRMERGRDGSRRMVLEEPLIVCGKRHKPNAFYVLQRSRVDFSQQPLRRSFVKHIPASVSRAPF